jgi:hypothetical protein
MAAALRAKGNLTHFQRVELGCVSPHTGDVANPQDLGESLGVSEALHLSRGEKQNSRARHRAASTKQVLRHKA